MMTPKSLLRHPAAVSTLKDFEARTFSPVISDARGGAPEKVSRILLCSGKVYYDLVRRIDELHREDIAVVRVEQLYPFPGEELRAALAAYPDGLPAVWVQEEPENMGAWRFLRVRLGETLFGRLPFSGVHRPASASPATGSASSYKHEQERLLNEAVGGA
jgi:2-oxoglutarate dehydrogenase E1 component